MQANTLTPNTHTPASTPASTPTHTANGLVPITADAVIDELITADAAANASPSTPATPTPSKAKASKPAAIAPTPSTPTPKPAADPFLDWRLHNERVNTAIKKVRADAQAEELRLTTEGRADAEAIYRRLWATDNVAAMKAWQKKWDALAARIEGVTARLADESQPYAQYKKIMQEAASLSADRMSLMEQNPANAVPVPVEVNVTKVSAPRNPAPASTPANAPASTPAAPAPTGNGPYTFTFTITEPSLVAALAANANWQRAADGKSVTYTFKPRAKKNPPRYDFTTRLVSDAPTGKYTQAQLEAIAKAAPVSVA